jgi:hypothetical protein
MINHTDISHFGIKETPADGKTHTGLKNGFQSKPESACPFYFPLREVVGTLSGGEGKPI